MDFLTSAAVTILSDDVELIKSRKRKFEFFETNNTTSKGSRAVRKWCFYAHFYSTLDQPYFNDNEFVACLSQLDIDPFEKFTVHTWRNIRQLMNSRVGLPRRLSKHFLDCEREKLKLYREEARLYQQQATKSDCYSQFQMNDTIQVGDTVVVYIAALKEFCQGCVLSSMPRPLKNSGCAQYLVQLEEQSSKDTTTATLKPMVFNDEYIYVVKSLVVEKPQPLFHQVSRQIASSSHPASNLPSHGNMYDNNEDDMSTVNFSQQSFNGDSLYFNSQIFASQSNSALLPPLPSQQHNGISMNNNCSSSSSKFDEILNPLKRSRSDINVKSTSTNQDGNETEGKVLSHHSVGYTKNIVSTATVNEIGNTSEINNGLINRGYQNKEHAKLTSESVNGHDEYVVIIGKQWKQNEYESERIVQTSMSKLKESYNENENSMMIDYIQNNSKIIELLFDCVNSLLTLTQQLNQLNNDKTSATSAKDNITAYIFQLTQKLGLSYNDNPLLQESLTDMFHSIVTASGV